LASVRSRRLNSPSCSPRSVVLYVCWFGPISLMMDDLDIRIPVCLSDSLDVSQYKILTCSMSQ
jgi:hypothetical protein